MRWEWHGGPVALAKLRGWIGGPTWPAPSPIALWWWQVAAAVVPLLVLLGRPAYCDDPERAFTLDDEGFVTLKPACRLAVSFVRGCRWRFRV
jgi:hypothetical protein